MLTVEGVVNAAKLMVSAPTMPYLIVVEDLRGWVQGWIETVVAHPDFSTYSPQWMEEQLAIRLALMVSEANLRALTQVD